MKLSIKKLLALLLTLSLLFAFCGCDSYNNFKAAFLTPKDPETPPEEIVKTIKIGVLEPLTGSDAAAAADEVEGIQIAFEAYPEVDGVPIELIYADNKSDVTAAPEAAQSLVDAGVQFIIGSYKSVLTLASSDVIKEAHIPAIAASNTNPLITQTNNMYYRACYVDSLQGEAAAEYVLSQYPDEENIAVLVKDGYDIGTVLSNQFRSVIAEKSPETEISVYAIPENAEDYEGYFRAFEESGISVVFFPSQAATAKTVISKSRELNYDFTWIGTGFWSALDEENVYFTMDYDPDSVSTIFKKVYALKHGNDAVASDICALGYDAYLMIYHAIETAGTEAEVLDYIYALDNLKDLQGATGLITMSGSGDPIKEVVVAYRTDGGLRKVFKTSPYKDERSE